MKKVQNEKGVHNRPLLTVGVGSVLNIHKKFNSKTQKNKNATITNKKYKTIIIIKSSLTVTKKAKKVFFYTKNKTNPTWQKN